MATETDTDTDPSALISEKVAGGILPKVLTTFDMVAIFVAIVLFITNAAVSGGIATRICTAVHKIVHVKKGIFRSDIPGARMPTIVATKLTPAAMVPMPLTTNPSAQKSVAAERANVLSVSGARANHPMAGAPPVAKLK